ELARTPKATKSPSCRFISVLLRCLSAIDWILYMPSVEYDLKQQTIGRHRWTVFGGVGAKSNPKCCSRATSKRHEPFKSANVRQFGEKFRGQFRRNEPLTPAGFIPMIPAPAAMQGLTRGGAVGSSLGS